MNNFDEDYKKSIDFWNECFTNAKPYEVKEKFIKDDRINDLFKKYINMDSFVLDYGCGAGWALPEIYFTQKFKKGLGLDLSENSINYANKCNDLSKLSNIITYKVSDESYLFNNPNSIDFIFSTNVLDVVPDDITEKIIDGIYLSLKKDGYALICLNPNFTEEELENLLKMTKVELENGSKYFYKNNILRCNYKSISSWEAIFQKKFSLIKSDSFKIADNDKYERRLYLLKK